MNDAPILVVIGTRPEAIKMFPVIHALRAYSDLSVRVCVTAQHREILDQVLQFTAIKPDIDLDVMRQDQSLDDLLARLVTGISAAYEREKPGYILVHGDTLTAMAASMAAYFRKIPVGHVEAGLRSGNIYHPWPEEANRKIITAIANTHFAPTATAAASLRKENIPAESIHVTGNTVIDALLATQSRIDEDPALAVGLAPIAARFVGKSIITITAHRRENFGSGMKAIAAATTSIAQRDNIAIVFPLHPNLNVRDVMTALLSSMPNIALIGALDYPHFVRLLSMSTLILTDSGGIQEEAAALGKPVLVMRETTERPEAILAGGAKLVGTDTEHIVKQVFAILDDKSSYAAMAKAPNPFGDGRAAKRIAEIVARMHSEFGRRVK